MILDDEDGAADRIRDPVRECWQAQVACLRETFKGHEQQRIALRVLELLRVKFEPGALQPLEGDPCATSGAQYLDEVRAHAPAA